MRAPAVRCLVAFLKLSCDICGAAGRCFSLSGCLDRTWTAVISGGSPLYSRLLPLMNGHVIHGGFTKAGVSLRIQHLLQDWFCIGSFCLHMKGMQV